MYSIKIINYKNSEKLSFQKYAEMVNHSPVITRKTFKEICEFIGSRPKKHIGSWSAFVGNTEYFIIK